ncbi:malonate decarboxylase subunit alpha [Afifella marina]|uniref:Malonate decarboxylase alpha subunit n=2 Tax=Hyphomicrobiales TaxID=356 RepID=A0A1G5P6V5_AFIMA|nr:malonate decarboxylase subunit alpha [Afifella marina]MBK1624868.1 malonate decarboxylase subunit alpha [Afifella marina DSM 2698]MBK1628462.1 malonate decarboxylase subunit alpha [Afifella marina]MBK5917949.1 malonate decarboxylase subunit alpha [Afifella marina]RAI18714.1 malonate decarboxylase subunit alpha [Afifella marina DSM 2698]SCZ45297.1 malonate decarboxylase alpha subunit [Afifella marina DSM 2698]
MSTNSTEKKWDRRSADTAERLEAASRYIGPGKQFKPEDTVALLEAVIRAGDRVNIEGNNQKQADFLAECLNKVDKSRIHDLHMVQSAVPLPVHLDLFENGIAKKLDFAFGGPQAGRVAKFISEGKLELGAIHTYLELFGRYFLDLTPKVSLICAYKADREGNLYTGFNTEDTPTIVEATKFRQGIVIAQVNEIVDKLPRVDIPADWIDAVVESPRPFFIEPLFTRDPGLVTESQILLAMLCLKGIYAEYEVKRINHGIGFLTSAIELLLPTYGEELGLKGKACTHMILNPHPTMIPAIESGWVDTIHCFGGELGMEKYVAARPDVFFTGPDGTLRSNRAYAQTAGHYALDMFIGGTLQIDKYGNSSTATASRVAGFGGAPNMGCDAKGRRHVTDSWLKCGKEMPTLDRQIGNMPRGKRLVVQGVETFGEGRAPVFVEELDAWKLAENANLDLPPVMIYGDDLTHVVTEEGIAYLNRCADIDARMAAIRAVAGYTEIGIKANPDETRQLREAGIVKTPEDLGVDRSRANRSLLAARNIRDLVSWSGGLYNPPARFRNW